MKRRFVSSSSPSSSPSSSGNNAWSGGYREIRRLGKGSYATVLLARRQRDGRVVAVKQMRLSRWNTKDVVMNEIYIMQKIKGHRNILTLYEYFSSPTSFQLILQYCEGGEILDAVLERKGLSENEAKEIMRQTFEGLRHCHKLNICHRDLKPQNLLLKARLSPDQPINSSTVRVLICDFGVATIALQNQRLRKLIGTVNYMAPRSFSSKL